MTQPETSTPKRRGGAPVGNTNALRHGRHSRRLRVGNWKGISEARPELKPLEERTERLEAQLVSAVVAKRQLTTLADMTAIAACTREAFLADRAIQIVNAGGLNPGLEVDLLKAAAAASTNLHRLVKGLDLDIATEDLSSPEALYRRLDAPQEVANAV